MTRFRVEGFLADSMLGRLTRWLRMMGYSVEYATSDWSDAKIMEYCTSKGLFLITRDRELSKRYSHSLYVLSENINDQLALFLSEFAPSRELFFTRCPLCNGKTSRVPMSQVSDRVPEGVRGRYASAFVCLNCGKVYWEGTHYDSILKTINSIITRLGDHCTH
ncbi:MAG: Mut7-C RNAse domain-containing protein [Candidatus Thermoplasmatota archaeon]|jgi:uncharacterized protein with PIN domain|nr:Mut7-C RNAse domain-containing protein [Candidatus Thermoplasmatota archaeon]